MAAKVKKGLLVLSISEKSLLLLAPGSKAPPIAARVDVGSAAAKAACHCAPPPSSATEMISGPAGRAAVESVEATVVETHVQRRKGDAVRGSEIFNGHHEVDLCGAGSRANGQRRSAGRQAEREGKAFVHLGSPRGRKRMENEPENPSPHER